MSKKRRDSKEFKEAVRFFEIWGLLFILLVVVVGVILYRGPVAVPFSATYLTNFNNLDLVKRWDDFKTDQPSLDPTIPSSPYFPSYGVSVNISETGLMEEIAHPKTVVSFHVSVRAEFLDKSILKLQSLLVLALDQNEKVRGKLYIQEFSHDSFLNGKNETDYTFWLRVPDDMQNQKYTIIAELFGVIDTSQSINYQRLAEDSYYLERDYGIYGNIPSWNYQNPNTAYFRFLAYDRADSHAPAVYSVLSLATYSLSLAGVISALITLLIGLTDILIGVKDRSKEFWKKNKLYVMLCIIFLILFIVILLLAGSIL